MKKTTLIKLFTATIIGFGSSSLYAANDAMTIMKNNGCLSCHAIASKKTAPAFAGIARRNKMRNGENAKGIIINSIKNGSSGKYRRFTNTQMPAFSGLTNKELNTLANFILAQSSKAKGHGKGMGRGMGMGKGRMNF